MKIRLTSLFKNNLNLLRGKKIVCLVGLGTVLTLTGCNKKDENTSTIVYNCTCQSNLDCRPTATPSNSNDNSNNNKFISGYNGNLHVTTSQSLEEVDKGRILDIEEENAKYFASLKDNNKTNNTTNATSNSTNNNNSSLDKVETQTQVEVTNEENTIIENEYTQVGVDENYQNTDDYEWSQDGNDVVYPEYPEYPIYPDVPSDIPTDIPSEVIPSEPEPTPVATYEGYVMKKLNNTTSIDGDNYWCAYYFNGDQIVVTLDDLGEMDSSLMDSNNSNIYGLSSTNTRDGWVYVRDNNVDDQFLDSCDNLDAQINAQLSEAIEARKEANAEYDNAMTLEKTLEN